VHIPDFVPDDVKKDLKDLGLEGIEELDELEARNTEGYNDLGLVPPGGYRNFHFSHLYSFSMHILRCWIH
jgi:hypothetical protein